MASDAIVQFSFAGLPPLYCFLGFDRLALDIANNLTGFIPGEYSVIIDSATTPVAEDRTRLWHKRIGLAPTGRLYGYYLGKWVTPHPIEANAKMRMWWTGTEAELWSYSGGDGTDPSASAPTATTGAMYERDTNYDFKFPLAMGTSPAPASTSVVPGDMGGEEDHTLTVAEGADPNHTHTTGRMQADAGVSSNNAFLLTGSSTKTGLARQVVGDGSGNVSQDISAQSGSHLITSGVNDADATVGHNNMPPYRVGMWAKRTGRIFITA